MRISIVMCTYNGALYIREQLRSIAWQTVLPWELVICDDGSSDATLQLLEAFAETANFPVRIFRNERNLGFIKNFEQAIQLCEGDLIALCDQDDVWAPRKLEQTTAVFAIDPEMGGVFCDADLITTAPPGRPRSLWQCFLFNAEQQTMLNQGKSLEVLLRRNVVTGMTLVFRSNLRQQILPIPSTWEHDAWIAVMLSLHAKLGSCDERLVQYRIHETQEVGIPLSLASKFRWIATRGASSFLARVHAQNVEEYQRLIARFDDLYEHLLQPGNDVPLHIAAQVKGKGTHCRMALEALSIGRLRRLKRVLADVDGYRRYSPTGLRAMIRDLIV